MRWIGLACLAAALIAGRATAQNSEMENFTAGANQLQAENREVVQRNIDVATRALQARDYATARRYAQPVTRADPKRLEAWLLLGTAQLGLEDWSRARTTYTTAVRITPNSPDARAGLGVALARSGDAKAQVQLAWFNAKIQACGGCDQAVRLNNFRTDIENAIAIAAMTPKTPG